MQLKLHPTHPGIFKKQSSGIWSNIYCGWEGILWEIVKGYHVLLGWNLKGIRETFGVPIYDRQLAVCVSTPIETMILEQ